MGVSWRVKVSCVWKMLFAKVFRVLEGVPVEAERQRLSGKVS